MGRERERERERNIQKKMKRTTVALSLLLILLKTNTLSLTESKPECKAWLVQSIPTDMPHLSRVPGVLSTADVFRWLAGNSSQRLDMLVQYWQLVAQPDDPRSGDYGYSKDDMKRFGANEGFGVYKALENAADRNVSIRFISYLRVFKCVSENCKGYSCSHGTLLSMPLFLQHSGVYPDYTEEPSKLASGRPNVKNVTLLLGEWWGSGIVHAKVWISDCRDIYIGSANNDWKSLTQVKEVGIYLAGCPGIAEKVEVYFDNLWKLAFLNVSAYTETVWDPQWQITRKVPCWSHFVHQKERSPLHSYVEVPHVAGYPELSDPYMFEMPIRTPGHNYLTLQSHYNYLSFAPPELLFGKYQADEQAWVDTIKSVGVGATVRINTMDWLGQSQYTTQTVYWSSLSSAISEVLFSKHAKVKILVAHWAHFINGTDQYLKSLLYSNSLCSSSKYNQCSGLIEIRYYVVPGFNSTGPAILNGAQTGNMYPGYTRVNHGKYAAARLKRLYESWEENPDIGFVMMKGKGRAFCSGADVVTLYNLLNEGNVEECKTFFRTLYNFVYLLGTYLKPHVAILDGITMGGGAGISLPGMFRFVTDKTVFAAPEAQMGFHPDAGASYYLSRLPGYLGEYLALTGEKLNGVEMIACGLATHYSLNAKVAWVEERLGKLITDDPSVIEDSLAQYGDLVYPEKRSTLHKIEAIDKCFSKDTVEEIISALETEAAETPDEWCTTAIKKLKEASPLSLKVTLQSIREGRFQSLDQCLVREYRVSLKWITKQGVRARLVDKDFAPKWAPSSLGEVTEDMVDYYFAPLGDSEPELDLPTALREPSV
ncbi:hypothetical protein RHMOL_Rhmol02G0265300 [Rhododendron molle]|uniref:Uncharacterized protein n=1 Tax=Rhododendron molle TaxID=49168 RepID=A0ACC0PVT4_RHOML|nr:hypothetical protein RHMOL_Rhmol02G0265300 [Rhododendron molle]